MLIGPVYGMATLHNKPRSTEYFLQPGWNVLGSVPQYRRQANSRSYRYLWRNWWSAARLSSSRTHLLGAQCPVLACMFSNARISFDPQLHVDGYCHPHTGALHPSKAEHIFHNDIAIHLGYDHTAVEQVERCRCIQHYTFLYHLYTGRVWGRLMDWNLSRVDATVETKARLIREQCMLPLFQYSCTVDVKLK